MEKEVMMKAMALLEALADSLGMTIKQLWPYFIKQAYIVSFEVWATIFTFIALFVLAAKKLFNCIAIYNSYYDDDTKTTRGERDASARYGIFWGICTVLVCFVLLIAVEGAFTDGLAFLNPEYWATVKILRLAVGK